MINTEVKIQKNVPHGTLIRGNFRAGEGIKTKNSLLYFCLKRERGFDEMIFVLKTKSRYFLESDLLLSFIVCSNNILSFQNSTF
jgi:hypothetical protein